MIQKVLTKYGLAIHLAVLAALPVSLTPFLTSSELGTVILWLSAFAGFWLMVEPSLRAGEHLSSARARVRAGIVRDPLFYFLAFVLVYALLRVLNSGIVLFYDAETTTWLVKPPSWAFFPASTGNVASLPLAVTIGVSVVLLAIRHGIGLAARISFGLIGSTVTALGGLAAALCVCCGVKSFDGLALMGFERGLFLGPLFGSWLILGLACGAQAEGRKWIGARFPFCVMVTGNVSGLIFFSPPLVALAWLGAALLVMVFNLVYLGRTSSMGAVARMFVLVVFGGALSFFLLTLAPESVKTVKRQEIDSQVAVSESYRQGAEALSRIGRELWKKHPWSGAGLGTFGLHMPFLAEKNDWSVLPAKPKSALNSYWNLLSERGIFGTLLLLVGFLMLVWTYCRRFVEAFLYLRRQDDADVFVFAVAPIVWTVPLIVVLYCLEAVWTPLFSLGTIAFSFVVPLALGAASFPRARKQRNVSGMAPENSNSEND